MRHLFISYAHKDDAHRDALRGHLSSLERRGLISTWDDRAIDAGMEWRPEIMEALERADIVVLLISSDFNRSKFCFETEMGRAFERWDNGKGGVEIIPVLVRNCSVEGLPFTALQCLPKGLKPVNKHRDQDSAWTEVVKGIEKALKRLPAAPVPAAPAIATAGAALYNLPPRNEHFTGRVDLLATLDKALADHKGRVALTQAALHGLGGIGKSQTALEYAWRTLDTHCVVWWLRAETEDTLLADLGHLAESLGVAAGVTDAEERAKAALGALAGKAGWLLVYDNAGTEQAVTPWLPRGGGAVILTSRDANWRNARPLDVEVMSPEDAVALLRERSGDGGGPAEELAQDLGYLPLALEQAAAYMGEHAVSLAGYLKRYRARRDEMRAHGEPIAYDGTVATTWEISFQAVVERHPAAGQLLNLCAFLAPDDIPLDLLRPGAAVLPSPLAEALADELASDDMVAALRRHSLVKGQDQALSLHRLVQDVLRHRLGDEAPDWAGHAVAVLRAVYRFDETDLASWAPAERLLPQVEAAAAHAEAAQVAWEATRWLLGCAGECLINRGRFTAGADLRKRALALAEANLSGDDPVVAMALNNLVFAYGRMGQWAEALPLAERAVAIHEGQSDPDPGELAADISNLSTIHWQTGALDKAEPLQRRALEMGERHLGSHHPMVARYLDNLAATLLSLGRWVEAEALGQRALAIVTQKFGDDHPMVATRSVNLAATLMELGRLPEARQLAATGLALFLRHFGDDHDYTEWARHGLAVIDARIADGA